MAHRFKGPGALSEEASSLPMAPAAIALSGLVILYGYLLWTRPSAKYRTASKLGTYLASKRASRSTNLPFYSTSAAYSLQRAVNTFEFFDTLSKDVVDAHWFSYVKLSSRHRVMGESIGYPKKLRDIGVANESNSVLARSFAKFAKDEFQVVPTSSHDADLNRGREALKHLVRDWSEDGKAEREATHSPILDALRECTSPETRANNRVLVPGSGLGRLAWEISKLGFAVTANEYSHFMTLPLQFLLSDRTTEPEKYSVQPYYFTLSHNRHPTDLFRTVYFPDVVPRISPSFRLLEGDFFALTGEKYDFLVTMFFIDTSVNIVDCLQQIFDLLTPGGTWINLGPLLWTSGSVARMELSIEEVISLAVEIGFEVKQQPRRVDTEYTSNARGMMRYIYEAEFWTAIKP